MFNICVAEFIFVLVSMLLFYRKHWSFQSISNKPNLEIFYDSYKKLFRCRLEANLSKKPTKQLKILVSAHTFLSLEKRLKTNKAFNHFLSKKKAFITFAISIQQSSLKAKSQHQKCSPSNNQNYCRT